MKRVKRGSAVIARRSLSLSLSFTRCLICVVTRISVECSRGKSPFVSFRRWQWKSPTPLPLSPSSRLFLKPIMRSLRLTADTLALKGGWGKEGNSRRWRSQSSRCCFCDAHFFFSFLFLSLRCLLTLYALSPSSSLSSSSLLSCQNFFYGRLVP